jgi:hypothetical protein
MAGIKPKSLGNKKKQENIIHNEDNNQSIETEPEQTQ